MLQTALLGEVGPRLRAVCCRNQDGHVAIQFYLDGPIASDDRESAACVVTEVIAALPEHVRISEELIQCNWPARLPPDLPRVYQRRE